MSKSIKNIIKSAFVVLAMTTIAACNKENLEAEKAIHVLVNGYNGSGNGLQIAIDTTNFSNSNFIVRPGSIIGFNAVYTYRSPKEKFLTITDAVTKRILLTKALPATGTKANFNFIYVDGQDVPVNAPPADPNTNKVGFYVHQEVDDEPFDIFLYRRDETTGEEYRHYLAKNVKPKTWIYVDYLPTTDFANRNLLDLSTIFFTKVGTTDQWAFQNSEEMSKVSASGMGLPLLGEKGLVLPYFLISGSNKLEHSRLFFTPDRF